MWTPKKKIKKKHASHFSFLAPLPQVRFSKEKKLHSPGFFSKRDEAHFHHKPGGINGGEEKGGWGVGAEPPRRTIKSERSVNSFGK